ncbi:hypothetical protein [Bradyrhizobium japonicum]|uniref:hypothetical protein n=1 Tax=Bradyrhizobium japonicum TaxID=375 RepID=UPI00200F7401|nr:hypothetical protein [Bradyrhizobium japonicum]UQD96120.1 hypothetical protein JEY30_31755 [Bradyrhizobium japonicum]
MHHMLTEEAAQALEALDEGAWMNTTHRVARELIAAGLAFEGWGRLEISESGRRAARGSGAARRAFIIDDPNIAEIGDRTEPRRTFELPPPPQPVKFSEPQMRSENLTWSRDRAARAAGDANGATDVWVEARWVAAFMDAYEAGN